MVMEQTSRTYTSNPTSRTRMTGPTSRSGITSSYYVGDDTSQTPSIGASRTSFRPTSHSRLHLSSTSPGIKPEPPHESQWKKALLTVTSVVLGVATIALIVHFIQQMSTTDYCKDVTCQNGGKCINGVDDFTCACEACFTGKFCGIDNFTPSGKRGSSAYCTSKQSYPTNITSLAQRCKELPNGYLAELNDEAEYNFLLKSLQDNVKDDDKKRHHAMLGARCEEKCQKNKKTLPDSVWRFFTSKQIVGDWHKKIAIVSLYFSRRICMWIVWNSPDCTDCGHYPLDNGLHHFRCQSNDGGSNDGRNQIVCEVDTDITTSGPTPVAVLSTQDIVKYVAGIFTLIVCFSANVYYIKQKYYSTSMRETVLHNEATNIETNYDTQSRLSRVPSRLSRVPSRLSRVPSRLSRTSSTNSHNILVHPASNVDQVSYLQTGSMSRSRLDTDMQTGGLSHSRLTVPQSSQSRSRTSNSHLLASQSKSRSRTFNSGLSTIQSRSQNFEN